MAYCSQDPARRDAPHLPLERVVKPAEGSSPIPLSKSGFVAGVQCLKRLYFQVHHRELAEAPDVSTLAVLQQGQEVGELAREAFPGGVLAGPADQGLTEAINKTAQLVADPNVQAIFEGTFRHDNILVRTDILARSAEGGWRLIEVKSSTGVKEHHIYDVGIQQYVLKASGLEVSPWLMYLNRDYIYGGRHFDLNQLFVIRNLAREIEALREELANMILNERKVLLQTLPPLIETGLQCTDPVRCEFYEYCNLPLPDDHVSLLPGISSVKVNQLIEKDIDSIHRIPPDFPLSDRQRRACRSVQTQETYVGKELKENLEQMVYPLFFMDFESVSPPIPRYAGMQPYDHIAFQWSVHVRRRPGRELEHFEFLAESSYDPRLPFLTSLLEVLGDEGHIVVYNRAFESQRLGELARWFPDYADSIAQVQARLWDLLDTVRKNVYHPRFRGSFSLKSVLPALLPDMTYEGMEVSNGREAGVAWEKLFRGQVSQSEELGLRISLLAYCGQDTLAMVRLLDFLLKASSGK